MPAVDPSILQSFVIGDELIVMQRWVARQGGPLGGKTVGEIMREFAVSIVRRHRDDESPDEIFPSPETRIGDGDHLFVQGQYDVLRKLSDYAVPV